MEEKENRYEVLNKGWDDVKTESRALELLQEAAEELNTFTLLAPWEESKIRLIKRLDDLQGDLDINIRPFDKKTYLRLITKDGEVYARAYCSIAGTNLRIRSQNWRKLTEEDRR